MARIPGLFGAPGCVAPHREMRAVRVPGGLRGVPGPGHTPASGTMTDRCGGIAWPSPAGNLCGEDPWCRYEPEERPQPMPGPADEKDLALLDALQDDIPLVSRPYDEIAARLNTPADEVMTRAPRAAGTGHRPRTLTGPRIPAGRPHCHDACRHQGAGEKIRAIARADQRVSRGLT